MIVGFKVNGAEGDTVEADTFSLLDVQDFDGVAVEDADDMAGEVGGVSRGRP